MNLAFRLLVVIWSVSTALAMAGEAPAPELGLERVKDRTFLEEADIDGYYGLLERARKADDAQLATAAENFLNQRRPQSKKFGKAPADKFPLFADLLAEPEAYRGQPLTLRGHSQEIKRYSAEENPYGITTLYECSLFTDDSQSHPTTLIFTEAPGDLPLGEMIVDQVVVSGYFLKLRAYHARDEKTRIAPLVLARTITWKRDSVRTSWLSPYTKYSLYGGLALVAVAWVSLRWRTRPRQRQELSELPTSLANVEIRDEG